MTDASLGSDNMSIAILLDGGHNLKVKSKFRKGGADA